jgi:hypothetical protein
MVATITNKIDITVKNRIRFSWSEGVRLGRRLFRRNINQSCLPGAA